MEQRPAGIQARAGHRGAVLFPCLLFAAAALAVRAARGQGLDIERSKSSSGAEFDGSRALAGLKRASRVMEKSFRPSLAVTPAKAGVQSPDGVLDSGLRRNDEFRHAPKPFQQRVLARRHVFSPRWAALSRRPLGEVLDRNCPESLSAKIKYFLAAHGLGALVGAPFFAFALTALLAPPAELGLMLLMFLGWIIFLEGGWAWINGDDPPQKARLTRWSREEASSSPFGP